MDCRDATEEDLVEELRVFFWFPPPRPVSEFFSRFSAPRYYSTWTSRLDCNLYYYATNCFILIMFIGMGLLQKPTAVLTAFATALSIAFFSVSLAVTSTDKVIRIVRKFSPHLAAKMRSHINSVLHGQSSIRIPTNICGRPLPLWVFVLFFFEVSWIFWWASCNLRIVPWALYVGLLVTLMHASFRERNLKGRFNTFKKEFRAAW